MIFIAHRINTIKKLNKIPKKFGIEIDLRDNKKDVELVHDPFKKGIKLKDFLREFKHKFLILNVKSEGIETKVLKLVKKYNINNYFFLDSSIPQIHKYLKKKNTIILQSDTQIMKKLIII